MNGPQLVKYHNELVEALGRSDFKPVTPPWKRSLDVLRNKVVSVQSELESRAAQTVALVPASTAFSVSEIEDVKDIEEGVMTPVYLGDDELQAFKMPTIRETALRLLTHVLTTGKDGRTVGMPYDYVVDSVRRLFPESKTTRACLRWYAVKVRVGEAGYEQWRLPQRRPRSSPTGK